MKVIVYACYPCLIRADGKEQFLEKNERIEFLNCPSKIYLYPTGKTGILPFEIIPNFPSSFYKSVQENSTIHIFPLDGFFSQTVEIHSFSNGSKIEISPNKLSFLLENSKKILSLPDGCTDFQCGKFNHIDYVIFSSSSAQHLICFNVKNAQVKTFCADNISLTDHLFTLSNTNGSTKTLVVDKEGLKIKSNSLSPSMLSNPLATASSFMECVKEKEYSKAEGFLSDELKSTQNAQTVQQYFGDISYIFPLEPNKIFALTNGEGKIFSFQICNGKIVDIEDN